MDPEITGYIYRNILKPVLFEMDPEVIHESFTSFGTFLGKYELTKKLTSSVFSYQNKKLEQDILGIHFKNPVGLSAGHDYNGYLVKILPYLGFGFSTVGSVTNKPYEGNPKPHYVRLPKSKSLLVNKGFKSEGADIVSKRLNDPELNDITFGVSVGSSNIPEIDSISKAIDDYCECFKKMNAISYIKYFELNISCPNVKLVDAFTNEANFSELLKKLGEIKIKRPILIKMPNEITEDAADKLVRIAFDNGLKGFIFSNLVKKRDNPVFDHEEIDKVKGLKGNFSGKPTEAGSNKLIEFFRKKYGNEIVIVGTGGIFTPQDAKNKIDKGANLVQLITGLIFEGPQLVGQINRYLSANGRILKWDH